jgi:hypothetical protein
MMKLTGICVALFSAMFLTAPRSHAAIADGAAQALNQTVRTRVNARTSNGFARQNYHFIFAINTASLDGDPAWGEVMRATIQNFLKDEAVSGDEVSFVPFQLQAHWEGGSVWRAAYPPHDPDSLLSKLPRTSLREGNYQGGHDDERALYSTLEKIEKDKAAGNWILFLVSDKDSSNRPTSEPRYALFNNEAANRQSLQSALKNLSSETDPGGYLFQQRVAHRGSAKPLNVRLYLGNNLTAQPLSVTRAARRQTDGQAVTRIQEAQRLLAEAERLAEQANLEAQDKTRLMELSQQVEKLAQQVKQIAGEGTALSQAADEAVKRARAAQEGVKREEEAKKRAETMRGLLKWLLIAGLVILALVVANVARVLIGFKPLTLDVNGNQRVVTRKDALMLVGPDTDWVGENRLTLAGAPVGELLAKVVLAPRGKARLIPESKSAQWVQEGRGRINSQPVVLERGQTYRFSVMDDTKPISRVTVRVMEEEV